MRHCPGSEANEAEIVAALSSERLAPYLRAAGGDLTRAVRLYEWNLSVSGALYEALGTLAGYWYDDPLGVLSDFAHEDIAAARRRVRKLRRSETPGRVIAELNFGFWKFLLAKRYEATLWTGHLRHGFPNLQPQSRATVYRALDDLHTVRNRVAHHEPIHSRDLTADTLTIYRLLDWIDADIRTWAVTLSRLQPIIAAHPR